MTQYWARYAESVSSSVFIQQWIRKIDKINISPLNTINQAVIYLSLLLGLWDDLTWCVSPWKHTNMSVLILIQLTVFVFFSSLSLFLFCLNSPNEACLTLILFFHTVTVTFTNQDQKKPKECNFLSTSSTSHLYIGTFDKE